MSFCRDKQVRNFCFFLLFFLLLLFALGAAVLGMQEKIMKNHLVNHDGAIVTSLIEQGVAEEVIAQAVSAAAVSKGAVNLLGRIGMTEKTDVRLIAAVNNFRQESSIRMLLGGVLLAVLLLGCTFHFLWKRDCLYQQSSDVMAAYMEGDFSQQMPLMKEGSVYQMLAFTNQLAAMYQSKSEAERSSKEFLKNTISDISHQLKTPLAALFMYQEIISEEPERADTVQEYAFKIGQSLKRMEMRSYLDLVPISAKVHKKQNRMSILCIMLAVFLVTAIFGMADMFIKGQIMQTKIENGNWHTGYRGIDEKQAKLISLRPEVEAFSWYGVLNYHKEQGYTLGEKPLIICGSDESWLTQMQTDAIVSGRFPQTKDEALITENAKKALGIDIGSTISMNMPSGGVKNWIISGFTRNVGKLLEEDSFGINLNTEGFYSLHQEALGSVPSASQLMYYAQFSAGTHIRESMDTIKNEFRLTDQQVSENAKLLGLVGQSRSPFLMQIYASALVMSLLVLLAGVIMITGSLNSNITRRIQFFGMMRCIGATPKQVMRFVSKEAFSWCRFSIPISIAAGMAVIWGLCALLRFLSPQYFQGMPVFGFSGIAITSGICMGLLTVFIAARAPAKRAAKVSPLAAVSGSAVSINIANKAANTSRFSVDTALGIRHALASKKNFILMTASFSLSIILFLAFSVTIDFMHHALRPMRPWTPDISLVSGDGTCSVSSELLHKMKSSPAVAQAFGRMEADQVPVIISGEEQTADIISYEENQFAWAKDYLLSGSIKPAIENENEVLFVSAGQDNVQTGDQIMFQAGNNMTAVTVAGLLSSSPVASEQGQIICSEAAFKKLTGWNGYTVIDLQMNKDALEADVDMIRESAGEQIVFSDQREGNSSAKGVYYSFALFLYGFLVLIVLITVFNIKNSISMSVSARMKQYGALRAVGLSGRQLMKMVYAEAVTYALSGILNGAILGCLLHKILYEKMITFKWEEPWRFPVPQTALIIAVVILSVILAVWGPAKIIRKMSIVETINAQ